MDNQTDYSSLGPGFETNDSKKKNGVPIPVLLFVLVSLLLAGISMKLFPESLSEYRIFSQAEERTKSGETAAALWDLYEVQEEHPKSLPVTLKLIELSMESGYYDLAAHVFNEYLVGKNLTDGQYAKMMRYSRRLDSYYLTYDSIEELMAGLEEGAEEGESEAVTEARASRFREELSKLHADEGQDQAYLYYYEAIMAQDPDTYYEFLQKSYAVDPELFDLRVLLGNAERSRGNFTKAHAFLEEALAKEAKDAGALRGLAVLSMLEQDKKGALEKARQAYESDPNSMYVRDTYLIALHLNQDEEGKEAMIREIEELEGPLEEDTRQLLEGSLTLQEYYMETTESKVGGSI